MQAVDWAAGLRLPKRLYRRGDVPAMMEGEKGMPRQGTPVKRRWEPPALWGGITWPVWVALAVAAGHPVVSTVAIAAWWSIIFLIARVYRQRSPGGDMGLRYAWFWMICSFAGGGLLMALLW